MNRKSPIPSVFLWLCMILMLSAAQTVYAEEIPAAQNVRMEVNYGYNNVAKGGRYLPVKVLFDNTGRPQYDGCIQVKLMESDGTIYLYEYRITLEAGSKEENTYYTPIGSRADQITVTLLDAQGSIEAIQRLRLNVSTDVSELFIGILSDAPGRLSYLDGIGVNYGSLRTHTFPLDPDEFPGEEIGLDLLDVILVTNYRLRDLSEKQTGAIMDWVSNGGVLLLGTGERVDDTLGRYAPELLDDSYGTPEIREVDMGMEYATDKPGEHILEIPCVDISLHGGNVISAADEFTLLTAATRGRGIVAVAAYDFTDIEDFCMQNTSYVDQMFTDLLGEERIKKIAEVLYSGNSSKFWSVQNLINTGDVDRLPKLALYVTVICIYLFILGPGLYIGLKKLNLQDYYQRGVLIISCCFAVIIYLMGSTTRFAGTFFNYASIQDVTEDFVTDTTYINIRNPYNTSYQVELEPSYSVLPITRNYNYEQNNTGVFNGVDDYQIAIREREESTVVDAKNIVSFTPKYFKMRRKYDNVSKVGISGEISLYDGEISGSITNGYDFPIEDTTLLFYGKLVFLSAMAPGETRRLDGMELLNCPVNHAYAIAEEITGENGFGSADIDNSDYLRALERMNLLAFYLENYFTSYTADARVIAFSSRKEENEFLRNGIGETYGLTMLTSSIAVDSYQGDSLCRSVLMKVPRTEAGDYSAATNSISGMEPVTLEYSLGNDIQVKTFSLEPLSELFSRTGRSRYFIPFEGNIYFFNYVTRNYDRIPDDQTKFDAEELAPYLSPGNTLMVRYVYNGSSYNNIVLPMPTVTGREK